MNKIVDKFLLAGYKFMPEIHLEQSGFTYSASGPFTKNNERIEKFMQTGNTDSIYRNELDKACLQHNVPYGKSKDLAKRTQSEKPLALFRMGFFGAAHGRGGLFGPSSLKSVRGNLSVTPYLRKIQKTQKSRDIP